MVCDVFILSLLKTGGLFQDIDNNIQVSEFTPRNLYELDIYDSEFTFEQCLNEQKGVCQIYGNYTLEYPGFNSIPIYKNMNQDCASLPPNYDRSIKC